MGDQPTADAGDRARIGARKSISAELGSSTLVLASVTPALSILIGLGLICFGFGLRMLLDPLLMNRASFVFFMPGVVAAAVLGGLVPALIVTAAGALAALGADLLAGDMVPGSIVGALAYALLGALIALGGRWYSRAREGEASFARELAERETMLSSVLRTIPDAMIIIDDKGTICDFSETAERQFGWTAEEVTRRSVNMLMPPPYREAHASYLARYLSTRKRGIIGIGRVLVGERKDGSTFPMELSVGEMQLPGGRFYTGLVHDLTERRKTETRLQELQGELVHMSRLTALGEMASALAHELNQPLSAIGNYLMGSKALLKRPEVPHERVAEAVERAGQEALRAGEIIRRLRDFVSRGETERRVESLPALVEDASALALVGAREAGVRVRVEIDAEVDLVLVDKIQIQQVILNLLRNAVDAMAESSERQLVIGIAAAPEGMAQISVADTGHGIHPDMTDQLFRPFVTTKPTGMGVGLSICRTIVEAHGGRIRVEGKNEWGGATFLVTIPRIDEEAPHDDG